MRCNEELWEYGWLVFISYALWVWEELTWHSVSGTSLEDTGVGARRRHHRVGHRYVQDGCVVLVTADVHFCKRNGELFGKYSRMLQGVSKVFQVFPRGFRSIRGVSSNLEPFREFSKCFKGISGRLVALQKVPGVSDGFLECTFMATLQAPKVSW